MQFLRDKFEVLFVGFLFIMLFIFWVESGYNDKVYAFLFTIFGAFLALLRVVQRPHDVPDNSASDNIVVSVSPKTINKE